MDAKKLFSLELDLDILNLISYIVLAKHVYVVQVERESIFWRTAIKKSESTHPSKKDGLHDHPDCMNTTREESGFLLPSNNSISDPMPSAPTQPNKKIPLYKLAHSRAGDKGNDLNFSIIPHLPNDINKLKQLVTADWVKHVVSSLLDISSFPNSKTIEQRSKQMDQVKVEIYEVPGIHSLNVVVQNILDGGVNCSRRIDRHGKTISDLILCQEVNWPPLTSEEEV